jgi:hypothetical protein
MSLCLYYLYLSAHYHRRCFCQVIKFDNEGLALKDVGRDIRLEVGTVTTRVTSFIIALYVPISFFRGL